MAAIPVESSVAWKTAQRFPLVRNAIPVDKAAPLSTLRGTSGSWLFNQHFQAGESPCSEGRTPVSWSGSSRMDAARGPVGHGWPIWTDPGTALA